VRNGAMAPTIRAVLEEFTRRQPQIRTLGNKFERLIAAASRQTRCTKTLQPSGRKAERGSHGDRNGN
jgi:hypothetical protein